MFQLNYKTANRFGLAIIAIFLIYAGVSDINIFERLL